MNRNFPKNKEVLSRLLKTKIEFIVVSNEESNIINFIKEQGIHGIKLIEEISCIPYIN